MSKMNILEKNTLLIECLNVLIKDGDSKLNAINDSRISAEEKSRVAFAELFRRLFIITRSIKNTYLNYNNQVLYCFPLGLQTRVLLLDTITVLYLEHRLNNSLIEFEKAISRLDHTTVKQIVKEAQIDLENGIINNEQHQELLKDFHSTYPNNIHYKNGSYRLTRVQHLSVDKMLDSIDLLGHERRERFSFLYKMYSKYEHYNSMSNLLLDHNPEQDFIWLLESLAFALQGFAISLKRALDTSDILVPYGEIEKNLSRILKH